MTEVLKFEPSAFRETELERIEALKPSHRSKLVEKLDRWGSKLSHDPEGKENSKAMVIVMPLAIVSSISIFLGPSLIEYAGWEMGPLPVLFSILTGGATAAGLGAHTAALIISGKSEKRANLLQEELIAPSKRTEEELSQWLLSNYGLSFASWGQSIGTVADGMVNGSLEKSEVLDFERAQGGYIKARIVRAADGSYELQKAWVSELMESLQIEPLSQQETIEKSPQQPVLTASKLPTTMPTLTAARS